MFKTWNDEKVRWIRVNVRYGCLWGLPLQLLSANHCCISDFQAKLTLFRLTVVPFHHFRSLPVSTGTCILSYYTTQLKSRGPQQERDYYKFKGWICNHLFQQDIDLLIDCNVQLMHNMNNPQWHSMLWRENRLSVNCLLSRGFNKVWSRQPVREE